MCGLQSKGVYTKRRE